MADLKNLDRVLSLEPGKNARAFRNITNTLSLLDSHFPRFPVMPGVLILESMGELAGLLLREETGICWQLTGAERVRFRHFVRPGDQLELTVELKERTPDGAQFSAAARVDGKLVTTVARLHLAPMQHLATGASA